MCARIGYGVSQLCCARILLSVLRTLLHGALPWLQPRNPVVRKVVERGRGPDPPDASVEVRRSARPNEAPQVRGSRRAAAVAEKPRPDARAAHARPAAGSALVVDRSRPWLA